MRREVSILSKHSPFSSRIRHSNQWEFSYLKYSCFIIFILFSNKRKISGSAKSFSTSSEFTENSLFAIAPCFRMNQECWCDKLLLLPSCHQHLILPNWFILRNRNNYLNTMFPVLLWIAKAGWKVMCPTAALFSIFIFFFLVYTFINIATCR